MWRGENLLMHDLRKEYRMRDSTERNAMENKVDADADLISLHGGWETTHSLPQLMPFPGTYGIDPASNPGSMRIRLYSRPHEPKGK